MMLPDCGLLTPLESWVATVITCWNVRVFLIFFLSPSHACLLVHFVSPCFCGHPVVHWLTSALPTACVWVTPEALWSACQGLRSVQFFSSSCFCPWRIIFILSSPASPWRRLIYPTDSFSLTNKYCFWLISCLGLLLNCDMKLQFKLLLR